MTMFERDFIERVESVIGSKPFSTAHTIADAIINEFIRLNKRVQELEHYEKLIQEWVRDKVEGLDNLEEIEKMVRLVDDINRKNAGVSCGWCNETFDTKDEIKQHALTCKDNPLAQRIAELEHICTSTIDAFNFHREGDQPTFSDIPKIVKQAISEADNRERIELLLCKAEQCIAELEQERRWIPVSEKPESGVPVLVWNGGVHTAFWDARKDDLPFGGNWVWYPVRNKRYSYVGGVRYWQPLPQPPQEENDGR